MFSQAFLPLNGRPGFHIREVVNIQMHNHKYTWLTHDKVVFLHYLYSFWNCRYFRGYDRCVNIAFTLWEVNDNWKLSGSYGIAKYVRVWVTKHNDQAPAVLLILCPTWFVFDFLTHDILHQDGHCSLPSLLALQQQYVLANCSPPLIAVDQVTMRWGSWLFCAAENYPAECLSQWFFNSPRVSFLTS